MKRIIFILILGILFFGNLYQAYSVIEFKKEIGSLKWGILDSSFDTSAHLLLEIESTDITEENIALYIFIIKNQMKLLKLANITDQEILYQEVLNLIERQNLGVTIKENIELKAFLKELHDGKTISQSFDEVYEKYSR